MMGCGWWNPPAPYKEDCYWYHEEQDMNAHIPYCTCKNQFPLNTCENCEDYHSRSKRTKGDLIRAMNDEELAQAFADACPVSGTVSRCCKYFEKGSHGCHDCWLEWLRQEVDNG